MARSEWKGSATESPRQVKRGAGSYRQKATDTAVLLIGISKLWKSIWIFNVENAKILKSI